MIPSQRYCTSCSAANRVQDAFCFACGQSLRATSPPPQYPLAGSATSTSTGLLAPNLLLKQRYRIVGLVGQGGFGAVYKAEDVHLGNRLLAVKEMSQSALSPEEIVETTENFKREALLLAALKHPNLPSIHEQFSEAGHWYLVMDFIEGETLEAHLKKEPQGHLSVEETLQIALQLCTVLSYLHNRQPPIIFRDLKPANIMLTPEGHLYLIDFGIARHFKAGQTRDTIAFGSAGYAAPEQYGKAQTTPRSDIYSLGATLHQLLTGIDPSDTPFQFAPLHLYGQSAPPGLEPLLRQMVDMHVSNRPASMIAVKQELQRIITQQSVGHVNIPPLGTQTSMGSPLQQAQTIPPGAHQQKSPPKIAASDYLKAKRYQEALAALEHALQLDPTDASLYNDKGFALYNLKRYQEALAALEHAIRLNPNYAPAFDNKGDTLSDLKRHQEALAAYEHAIRLDPTNARYYNDKGLALDDLKRYQEALAAFEYAIELNPTFPNAYYNKGMTLYNLKRYTEALVVLDQAMQLDPKNSMIFYYIGFVLVKLGRYKEALAAYDRAIQLDPTFSIAFNNKGVALERLGRYKEALAAYDRAIQLDPKNSMAFTNKGAVLGSLGRYKEALELYRRAENLDPSNTVAKSKKEQLEKLMKQKRIN